jgi:uncharacterized protein
MPEYLAPGVYVEEVSYRSKSIEGVGTTTTGFVGPTRYGPVDLPLEVVTSLVEFERTYGDRHRLEFWAEDASALIDPPQHNYMWHAARAFFENGGKRLYVQRVFRPLEPPPDGSELTDANGDPLAVDGRSFAMIGGIAFRSRFPGEASRRRVRVSLSLGPNVLAGPVGSPRVNGLQDADVVWISYADSPPADPGSPVDSDVHPEFYSAVADLDPATGIRRWQFQDSRASPLHTIPLEHLKPGTHVVQILTATVTVYPADPDGQTQVWDGLPIDPAHERSGSPDSMFDVFAEEPENRSLALTLPIVIDRGTATTDGLQVLAAFEQYNATQSPPGDLKAALLAASSTVDPRSTVDDRSIDLLLTGGNDGRRPTFTEYEGEADPDTNAKSGLVAFEDIDEIAIVAAPGSSQGYEQGRRDDALTVAELVISHCERMRYRIGVLDSGDGQSLSQVRAMRGMIDTTYAAFYYPWVEILDPVTQREIPLPPSGFVAGIYARNDVNRAVYKAPANEVVTLALGFEKQISKAQQEILNPEGINCFRFFEGRGFRVWGARTVSSDPEWKYVNVRRYFNYLEASIDRGTQWAVFEPNGEQLWANVRRTVSDFLFNEFQMGALLGDKPEVAFFVKCDRTTMTQNDLDNGRLVCLIGVAPLRPAEFVIFRIGQWTADAKR